MTIDLDNLPDICTTDNQLCSFFCMFGEYLLDFQEIREDNNYFKPRSINDLSNSYCKIDCFNILCFEERLKKYQRIRLANFFKRDHLIKKLENSPKNTNKKQISRLLIEHLVEDVKQPITHFLLCYLSGLYRLSVVAGHHASSPDDTLELEKNIRVNLCEDDAKFFIEIESPQNLHFSDKHVNPSPVIPTVIESFKVKVPDYVKIYIAPEEQIGFKGIQYGNINFLPITQNDETNCFRLDGCQIGKSGEQIFIGRQCNEVSEINNLFIQNANEEPINLACHNLHNTSLTFDKANIKLHCENCTFDTIKWRKCQFQQVPYFDENSYVQYSSDIDNPSVNNFKNIDGGELEYVRLTHFFSRSGAYIQAHKFHRHYLLAKASKDSSKLKYLIYVYDWMNKCGTSISASIAHLICVFLWMIIIFWIGSDFQTGIYNAAGYVSDALHQLTPLMHVHHKPNTTLQNQPFSQIALYCLTILSYILIFLTALTIRKYLRIRE